MESASILRWQIPLQIPKSVKILRFQEILWDFKKSSYGQGIIKEFARWEPGSFQKISWNSLSGRPPEIARIAITYPPKWRSSKKSKIGTDFSIFHRIGELLLQIQFPEGWIFKTQEFSIFPNRSKRYACRSVQRESDFPVPAWVPRGRCPYKNWNEMEVPEKLQKVEVGFLPFRTRVPQIVCK